MSRKGDNVFKKNLNEISEFKFVPEGWETFLIQDIFEIGRGRVISQGEINSHPGNYPVYSSQSFNNGVMGLIDTFDFDGDYLTWTTDGAYAGTVFYRDGKFSCTNVCGTLKARKEKAYTRFFLYHLGKISKRYVSYVGNPKLMNDVMANIAITVPPIHIQIKIAKILSTADAVIEKTQAAIAKYKAIKQGMLQDLFTRGIDITTNQLRPRYEDAPHLYKESKLGMIPREWGVERLGNRAVIEYGKSQKAFVSLNGTIPVYGTGGLMEYATEHLFDGESILIGRKGTIDKPLYIKGKFWTVDTAYYLTSFAGNIRWLHSQLEFYNLKRLNEATGVPSINRETLYNILLSFPVKIEQDEIEKRIISIDNKLQTEQTYLQKMQSLKKGLMEDLLSGRKQVRVEEEIITQNEN